MNYSDIKFLIRYWEQRYEELTFGFAYGREYNTAKREATKAIANRINELHHMKHKHPDYLGGLC